MKYFGEREREKERERGPCLKYNEILRTDRERETDRQTETERQKDRETETETQIKGPRLKQILLSRIAVVIRFTFRSLGVFPKDSIGRRQQIRTHTQGIAVSLFKSPQKGEVAQGTAFALIPLAGSRHVTCPRQGSVRLPARPADTRCEGIVVGLAGQADGVMVGAGGARQLRSGLGVDVGGLRHVDRVEGGVVVVPLNAAVVTVRLVVLVVVGLGLQLNVAQLLQFYCLVDGISHLENTSH